MKPFGGWTTRTRKERREQREEQKWASRNGEITITHVQDTPPIGNPERLLNAKHDTPDQTGKLLDYEVEEHLHWVQSLTDPRIRQQLKTEPGEPDNKTS